MPDDTQKPFPQEEGPESQDEFEEALRDLPTDLGDAMPRKVPIEYDREEPADQSAEPEYFMLDAVPMFDNSDLDDSDMTCDEMEAMLRLFDPEQLASGLISAPGGLVKEMALRKMVRLAKTFVKVEQIRQYVEAMGGDTDDDLLYGMLSVVGEMSRLRTLIPKLGYEQIEAEGMDGFGEDEEAA